MWKFRSALLIRLPSRRRVCREERVNRCKNYYKYGTPPALWNQGSPVGLQALGSGLRDSDVLLGTDPTTGPNVTVSSPLWANRRRPEGRNPKPEAWLSIFPGFPSIPAE